MRALLLPILLVATCAARAQDPCDVSLTVDPPSCPDFSDGSITVVLGTGGPFTYEWSHAPTLNSPYASGLSEGAYTVTVTGPNCVSVLDTVVVDPTAAALGNMTSTYLSCAGNADGSVTFHVNPGPYSWFWIDDPTITNVTRSGLGAGEYTVMINGGTCPSYVTGYLGDPDIHIGGQDTYCLSDLPLELSADPDWGFQPDIYLWSTGATTRTIPVSPGMSGPISVTATDTTIGCVASGDFVLTALPGPTVAFSAPDSVCERVSTVLVTTVSDADSLVWRWGSAGFSNDSIVTTSFADAGWLPVSLQGFDAAGCGSLPVPDSIFVRPRLPAIFTAEQVPCTPTIEVRVASTADSCAFFVGDQLMFNTCRGTFQLDLRRYDPYDMTFYSTQPDHCDDTSAVHLELRIPPILALPNAFTPNGDGINDTWPGPIDIPELDYEVQLFDREGHSLWATMDTQAKWDGAALPNGVYVYALHMRDPCEPERKVTKNGSVTLLR